MAYGGRAGRRDLLAAVGPGDRARIRSASGAGAGDFVLHTGELAAPSFTDRVYTAALQLRFGVTRMPGTSTGLCQLVKKDGALCMARMTGPDHCMRCRHGTAYYAVHHAIADMVHCWYRTAGYHATREACVPALSTTSASGAIKDAYLDVAALSSTNPDAYIDVTVRHAPSDHYMPRASEVDGATFSIAASDKKRTYPTKGG